jgi:uncharacterized iron-regulated protein
MPVLLKAGRLVSLYLCLVAACFCLRADDLNLKVLDEDRKEVSLSDFITELQEKRVVWIGENHDRYDNHLAELEIIRRLHEATPQRWVIGVEFIQRKFQSVLDDYVAHKIDEREFLKKSEYFDRWGFDYRLYQPIFAYARENGIPLIALNAEAELTEEVGKVGLSGLSRAERNQLPADIDTSNAAYRDRLNSVFQKHPDATKGNFEHFFEAQLTWDETMADTAARYLRNHDEKAMILLAGGEHIAYGYGIPDRMKRRIPEASGARVLVDPDDNDRNRAAADYFLETASVNLPAAGRMGVVMDTHRHGVIAKQVTPEGAAAQAGLKTKDRIASIDGQIIQTVADARLALLNKMPGQTISIEIERSSWHGKKNRSLTLILKN